MLYHSSEKFGTPGKETRCRGMFEDKPTHASQRHILGLMAVVKRVMWQGLPATDGMVLLRILVSFYEKPEAVMSISRTLVRALQEADLDRGVQLYTTCLAKSAHGHRQLLPFHRKEWAA